MQEEENLKAQGKSPEQINEIRKLKTENLKNSQQLAIE